MTKTQDKTLQAYADLKAKAAEIAEEIKALEPKVLGVMKKSGFDTIKEPFGTFSIVRRKVWTYSPAVLQKELEYNTIIKDRKAEEQKNGEAKVEEKEGLTFRAYVEKETN